ncbi:ABC transporter ATP-binding protein [Weissella muntiaci]|uniref:ABC transporter ATP-binding protein n=1 Tax=Weissella muntiaci TaxID=2508881 RepID=A0A6C2C5R3_9LACO|nr:ABC transporter ATP-binding protein [Weissella muntiaci]TYC49092.1 ABC transporter ATP-binding protein [Weissella muntiaci]
MATAIRAKGLTKRFGDFTAVKDVNLEIEAGKFIAFLGPNGAGKSTAINMLTTLDKMTAGKVEINGFDIEKQKKQAREAIGLVFQKSVLSKELTVNQNLLLTQRLVHASDQYTQKMIETFQLKALGNRKVGKLSGGQRRRVDIVNALLSRPKILFLDEPTTALDIQTRSLIWEALAELRRDQEMTVFLTTHYLEEAEQSDQIYILDRGEILAQGSAAELEEQYTTNLLTVFDGHFIAPVHWVKQADQYLIDDTQAMLKELIKQKVNKFSYRQGTLDDVFVTLTGKEVRA